MFIQDANAELIEAINRLTNLLGGAQSDVAAGEAVASPSADSGTDLFSAEGLKEIAMMAKDKAIEFAPSLASAVAILFLGWLFARAASSMLTKALSKSKLDPTLANFAASCTYMGVMAFVFVSAITKLGVNTASFIAVLGAVGFALGFALQGSLSNFAAGVMLMIFRPIREGDLIEACGIVGHVHEIGVFATLINTLDNKRAVIANSEITANNIINFSTNGKLRVDMTFGIGYGDDMDKAQRLMMEVLESDERVLQSPAPTVACSGHGASSVDFICRPYVKPEHYWDVWFATHQKVKASFDANGVSIPFPQRDVHMIPAVPPQ